MRPWRSGGRPGCGIAVLHADPRDSGKPGARVVVAGFPGRCGGGNRKHRPARTGAHRIADGAEGDRMTAQAKFSTAPPAPPSADRRTGFDVEKARADFEILSREVYGKPMVYLDPAARAQKRL